MKIEELEKFMGLCNRLNIKTLADLKKFEEEHKLVAPTGSDLIQALEKELNK